MQIVYSVTFFESFISQHKKRVRKWYRYHLKAEVVSFQTVPVSLSDSFFMLRNERFEKSDTIHYLQSKTLYSLNPSKKYNWICLTFTNFLNVLYVFNDVYLENVFLESQIFHLRGHINRTIILRGNDTSTHFCGNGRIGTENTNTNRLVNKDPNDKTV